jgi:predicted nucleic acid-binding protein
VIYLDASAMVTMVIERAYADDLREYLAGYSSSRTYTSSIGFVETVRTCDSIGTFPGLITDLLRQHHEVKVTDQVRDDAARLPGRLRSLDAIHVASASLLGSELIALVTYDQRMAEAASGAGLPVAMPGMK